jgi:hypothetical protein
LGGEVTDLDDLLLPVPPLNEWGDARRKLARKVASKLLAQLEAGGLEPELLAEVEEIFQDCGMMGSVS